MKTINKIALVIFIFGVTSAFAKNTNAQSQSKQHTASYSKMEKEIGAALKGISNKSIVSEKRYKKRIVDFFQMDPARSKFQIGKKTVTGLC